MNYSKMAILGSYISDIRSILQLTQKMNILDYYLRLNMKINHSLYIAAKPSL